MAPTTCSPRGASDHLATFAPSPGAAEEPIAGALCVVPPRGRRVEDRPSTRRPHARRRRPFDRAMIQLLRPAGPFDGPRPQRIRPRRRHHRRGRRRRSTGRRRDRPARRDLLPGLVDAHQHLVFDEATPRASLRWRPRPPPHVVPPSGRVRAVPSAPKGALGRCPTPIRQRLRGHPRRGRCAQSRLIEYPPRQSGSSVPSRDPHGKAREPSAGCCRDLASERGACRRVSPWPGSKEA